jgi:hypothetical protein
LSNDLVIFDNLGKICLQRVNICVRAPFNMGVSHRGGARWECEKRNIE